MDQIKNTYLDYSDEKKWVYFEVPDKERGFKVLMTIKPIIERECIKEVKYGLELFICNQLIPEVVRSFSNENMAIYRVIRLENK